MTKTWSMLAGAGILSMPRSAVIRSFVLNHIIHHRGIVRLPAAQRHPVPALYGPSGDEGSM